MRRGYVDTAVGQMHYREQGSGPAVVLIHQALRSSLEYRLVMPLLADRYRVIAVDLMGYGDSDMPAEQLYIPEHAACVAELIEAFGIAGCAVAGHHTGGNVALELAASRPDLVGNLVLSGPAVVIGEEEHAQLVEKMSAIEYPRPAADGSHLLPIWNEGRVSSFDVPRIPDSEVELLADFFIEQIKVGPRRKEAHIAAFSHAALDRMPLVTAPVCVLVGTEDMWACARGAQLAAAKPGAQLFEFPTAGEIPRLFPDIFATTISTFLEGK